MSFENHKLFKLHDANIEGVDRYTYGVTNDSIVDITSDGYFPMSVFRGDLQSKILIDVNCVDGFFTLRVAVETGDVGKANGIYEIEIHSGDQLEGDLSSNALYLLDGHVDVSNINIVVPVGGLHLKSYGNSLGGLTSSTDDHSIFTSGASGSGNLFLNDMGISATGNNSKVFDLTDATGNNAVELTTVNFNGCTSLGSLTDYRQYLEINTGRFGGTPELEFNGDMNGARITTSILRGASDFTSLFKTGTDLTFSGRFVTDINCDLPAVGSFIDFSQSQFTNNESLIITGATITREGVQNPDDVTLSPNIDQTSVKSSWRDNVGLANTVKYVKSCVSAEIETPLTVDVWTALLGTWDELTSSHIEMTNNGEWKRLTGFGELRFSGNLVIDGRRNDEIHVRTIVSEDGGVTFTREINSVVREINNFSGNADVAFFPISFIGVLNTDELVRFEVKNVTASRDVTLVQNSCLDISQV